jgi:two-component system phosphate regulon sensor histidine kinase PhoR
MSRIRVRIFWPLFGALLFVSGAALVLGETAVASRLRGELVGIFETELRRELGLGREVLARTDEEDPEALARFITERLGYRVSIIALDGEVLGDSDVRSDLLAELENHAARPEIRAVLNDTLEVGFASRESATLGVGLLYGATRASLGGTDVVLRIAVPLDAIDASLARLRRWILGVGLFGVGVSSFLAILLAVRMGRPLGRLATGTRRLAEGQLHERVEPDSGFAEIDRVAVSFNRLASELSARLGELGREAEDMQSLLDSIDEGIIALTEDARIQRVNKAALSLLGLSEPIPFSPIGALIRQPDLRELIESAAVAPIPSTEVRVGERFLIVASRLREDGGALVTLLDITEIRRLETVRSDFVANASHELKTPLTSMRGFAETLLEADPPPDLRAGFLESIRDNSIRLQRLVDDLLDLSRLESGGWIAKEEEVEALELAREVWAGGFEDVAGGRGVAFHSSGSVLVLADERGLEQVFRNLFDNALRHSSDGGRVRVTALRRGPVAEISVSDDGSGIPAAALPRIFERFFRADPARSRAEGGTGLGLAIVRHMIQAMGGEVGARSELGQGTTIWFTLPLIDGAGE